MKAVRFDHYGDVDVLDVREVDDPVAAAGQVVVRVRAAAVNPGDGYVREGLAEEAWALRARLSGRDSDVPQWSMTFPVGQGMELAGEIAAVGDGVEGWHLGDHVLGGSASRTSHAELAAVPADHLVAKPAALSWEVAGSMFVAPMAALASIEAVSPGPGETVVVSGAAGAVGLVAVQLARRSGAAVIGLTRETNHAWMREHGVTPVTYGDGQAARIRSAAGNRIDAFIDTYGAGYVDLAHELGVPAQRINTVVDFQAGLDGRAGIAGTNDAGGAAGLQRLTDLVAAGELDIPVAATYPLTDVREACRRLAERRTRGKIVLLP
ncbi:NADP-dependent oxidoreductase [Amycolatopsis jiangsuensis]|uniref:NADPH:quinone reductase-like Zn-dependent oxidoreductase n=1 Tax=Amycolatopsis jiangsuensis TaxID=1181879 RepID=A0A840IT24_9PSEU|nr:NADP-dependent oxidoreductase [Amycolatopsis jiangsuensis]MBB4684689.1 NADPH:quinone reductase-like Zn-dependent oxidoreductase [Amycolatopsis jiangsuensis]